MAWAAAIPAIAAGVQAVGGLAGLFSQNRFNNRQLAQRQREFEAQMKDYEEQKKEREEDKLRALEAERMQNLFANATWLGDKNKERIEQNYGHYLRNLMGRS